MQRGFAPLALTWRLKPGARLPGLRVAAPVAAGEGETAVAPPPDGGLHHAMQAIVGGATEDRLLALAGASPASLYHLLAQFTARRLLEVTADLDGRTLCRLALRERSFQLPSGTELPARVALDRFAYLRAGERGATLQAPHAPCDIVVEAPIAGALIVRLAAAPLVPDDQQDEAERALLALLVALGFAGDADAPEASARRTWQFHDRLFHVATQLHGDGVARGATFRFRDLLPPPPALRPRHAGTDIALPAPRAAAPDKGRTLHQVMQERRSHRDVDGSDLTIADLSELLDRVGRIVAMPQAREGSQEMLLRPIPSAGALQALEFYVATHGCAGLPAGLFHYRGDIHGLTRLHRGEDAAAQMLEQCARAWDQPGRPPPVLVVLAARLPRLAWKYEGIAYRLALLDAGAALQSLYLVATDLGLAGAAVGAGDAELFAQATGTDSWEETCIAAFGLGRPRRTDSPAIATGPMTPGR
jgi:oxazoline/thiazoline dehydrogenase